MSFSPNSSGGDLTWWRASNNSATVVAIWPGAESLSLLGPDAPPLLPLSCRLFDKYGDLISEWPETLLPGRPLIIDSRHHPEAQCDGVLAILANIPGPFRFYSMVDWFPASGGIISLHSDHSINRNDTLIEFTEIVLREGEREQNSLVFLNGPEPQPVSAVTLRIRNHCGEIRQAEYVPAMRPFSLHKLELAQLFPNLIDFTLGAHFTVEGVFTAHGIFSRPYVLTEGEVSCGYHGGDRYRWAELPGFIFRALGGGEMNPMAAVHSAELTTTVNLLHSHGHLEEDFWVDACLYDEQGERVARRERWLLARRGAVTRGEISDLLDGQPEFTGHIALTFTDDNRTRYPRRLQALLEYRGAASTARVMAWSSIWNGRDKVRKVCDQLAGFFPTGNLYNERLLPAGALYRCHYRVWAQPPISTLLAITNCGLSPSYNERATYFIHLYNHAGQRLTFESTLGPNATFYRSIDDIFPGAEAFLAPAGIGIASVESRADLAVVQFCRHAVTGAVSAEHFLQIDTYVDGVAYRCCGA